MSELKQVTGTMAGITEKASGWYEIQINHGGSKYPLKLATKLEKLIEEARAVGGELAVWSYKEMESDTINEHTGTPYKNRYFEGVEIGAGSVVQNSGDSAPAGAGQQTQVSTPVSSGQSGGMMKEDWDQKERRDYMSRSWAHTISAYSHTIKVDADPVETFTRLQVFQRKLYNDICGTFAYPENHDDIPF